MSDETEQETCSDHGGVDAYGEPCEKPAGYGTDRDTGRCKHHPEEQDNQPDTTLSAVDGDTEIKAVGLDAPDWMDGRERDAWELVVPLLKSDDITTPADRMALIHLVQSHALILEAQSALSEGLVTDDSANNRVRKSPAFQIWRDTLDRFLDLSERFGLTPEDRAELGIWDPSEAGEPEETPDIKKALNQTE